MRVGTLVTVWPGDGFDEKRSGKINAIYIVVPARTLEQDVELAVSQLVEIAVRALGLEPGISSSAAKIARVGEAQ